MSDVTANRDPKRQEGISRQLKMSNVHLYEGTLVSINSSGYAVKSSDTSGDVFAGIAREEVDNSAGSAGDLYMPVWSTGVVELAANWSAAQTDVGTKVYAVDNHTVDLAANTTNDVLVGIVVEVISASVVRVAITPDNL